MFYKNSSFVGCCSTPIVKILKKYLWRNLFLWKLKTCSFEIYMKWYFQTIFTKCAEQLICRDSKPVASFYFHWNGISTDGKQHHYLKVTYEITFNNNFLICRDQFCLLGLSEHSIIKISPVNCAFQNSSLSGPFSNHVVYVLLWHMAKIRKIVIKFTNSLLTRGSLFTEASRYTVQLKQDRWLIENLF